MAVDATAKQITLLRPEHWPAIARIYAEGIATGDATFETEVPSWERWDSAHLGEHRFVAMCHGEVVGWVAAGAVSDRCVYAGVVEHSVCVAEAARSQRVGRLLLEALIASTEAAGIWTIQTGIFPENVPSLRLARRADGRAPKRRRRLNGIS
jgi:phosphinothricin acetyltransferase